MSNDKRRLKRGGLQVPPIREGTRRARFGDSPDLISMP
jgi:hypothetical protein